MSTLVAQTISNGTVSTSSANVIQGSAKAWVNFTDTGSTSVRASYNVSSVTRNGTGDYTVNFTNAMSDANYSAVISSGTWGAVWGLVHLYTFTSSSVRFLATNPSATPQQQPTSCVAIYR